MLILIVLNFCNVLRLGEGFTVTNNMYRLYSGKKITVSFDSVISLSRIDCCRRCELRDGCLSVSFEKSSKTCQFVPLPSLALNSYSTIDYNWNVYSTDDEWLLVFRGTSNAPGNVYDAWVLGNNVVTDDVNCMRLDQTSCTSHYRNTIVDSWSNLGITKVKLSVFKDGIEQHYVIFNGQGSTHVTWFDSTRILSSSWTDLATRSFNYFSLAGFLFLVQGFGTRGDQINPKITFPSFAQRKFYISGSWSGCPADIGYLLVSSAVPDGTWTPCAFDIHNSYPTILYAESVSGGAVLASATGVGKADFFAIFISTS